MGHGFTRWPIHADRRSGWVGALIIVAATAALAWPGIAEAGPSSTHYEITQSTLNGGGQQVDGATYYSLNSSLSQESVIGTSSSTHYVVQSGFWSFAGTGLADVVLYVNKNGVDPNDLDLEWTGINPPYQIYRGDCSNITAWYFTQEPTNGYTDTEPLDWTLSCYKVLPTAPGPMAERPE